jgi:arylsulfatase A-like enzyme
MKITIGKLTIAILMVGISSCSSKKISKKHSNQNKPNVLVIMVDQLNVNALSCYGGEMQTPNIDRLANEGVRFDRAYCTTPFCSPSRASIVTGQYLHEHGIVQNMGWRQKDGITIDDETTEKILSENGYETHHYGKWHVESDSLPYLPYYPDQYDFGYQYKKEANESGVTLKKADSDEYMNFYGQSFPVEGTPYMKGKREHLDSIWSSIEYRDFVTKMGRLKIKPEEWIDGILAKKTIARIKESGETKNPFMLTCSFIWPHDPNFAPSPYYEMFNPDSLKVPEFNTPEQKFENSWSRRMVNGYGDEGLKEFLRIYHANVKYLDDRIGEILGELEAQGKLDETLIIFTADHGDMMGEHGMTWKSNESFYEAIANIPFIIRYPKLFKPGVSSMPISLVDIKPTILSVVGEEYKSKVSGTNIVPFFTGEKSMTEAPKYSFCERIQYHPEGKREILSTAKGAFMVRNNRYKLNIYPDGDVFLYDLENDPNEMKNVIDNPKFTQDVLELEKALSEWLKTTNWKGVPVKFKYL